MFCVHNTHNQKLIRISSTTLSQPNSETRKRNRLKHPAHRLFITLFPRGPLLLSPFLPLLNCIKQRGLLPATPYAAPEGETLSHIMSGRSKRSKYWQPIPEFHSCHHNDSFVASETHKGQVLYITSNKLHMTLPNNTVFGFHAILLGRTLLFCRSSHSRL